MDSPAKCPAMRPKGDRVCGWPATVDVNGVKYCGADGRWMQKVAKGVQGPMVVPVAVPVAQAEAKPARKPKAKVSRETPRKASAKARKGKRHK